jgi:hypothetical protein
MTITCCIRQLLPLQLYLCTREMDNLMVHYPFQLHTDVCACMWVYVPDTRLWDSFNISCNRMSPSKVIQYYNKIITNGMCRWQSTRRRHSVPGGGRIVFAGDLYIKGWQLYKQGQTTAPLSSAGETTRRRDGDGKMSMCNVSTRTCA